MNEKELVGAIWEKVKKVKTLGIVISIFLILVGIFMFSRPFKSDVIMICLMVVGLLMHGIGMVFEYFSTEKESRSGWTLAAGILWIVSSVVLLNSLFFTVASLTLCAGISMGVSAIMNGINYIANSGKAKELGRSKAGMIAGGILAFVCGIIILGSPVISTIAITYFYGILIFIIGVTLLINCLLIKKPE